MQRQDQETVKSYKIRLCKNKEKYQLTWPMVANLISEETGESCSETGVRKWWTAYLEGFTDAESTGLSDDEVLKEYDIKKQELQKEKYKIQTEKIDLNKRLRETARIELFLEQIEESIMKLKPIPVPEYENIPYSCNEAIAVIADAHFGSEFVIKGLRGETINAYSPEIFEERMWNLCGKLKCIIEKENINKLYLLDLSDALDGLIHINQLLTLRYGLVDSTLKYAEFVANWLNELSKYCLIEFRNTNGNHTEIRPYNSKRNDFPEENMERIISHIIKLRLRDNPRVTVFDTDMTAMFFQCAGLNIVGCHGQNENSVDRTVAEYRSFYNVEPDIVFEGHLHRGMSKTVGANANNNIEVFQCPSIIGTNTFAAKHKWGSKAGSKVFSFNDDIRTIYDIILN